LRNPWAATLRRVENKSRPRRPEIALCALMNAAGVGKNSLAGFSRMNQHSFVFRPNTVTPNQNTIDAVADCCAALRLPDLFL
jgi:hypothetical protein